MFELGISQRESHRLACHGYFCQAALEWVWSKVVS